MQVWRRIFLSLNTVSLNTARKSAGKRGKDMKIERFVLGPIGTNCYIVINEETKECFLTDPSSCPPELVCHIRDTGLQVRAVLLTHGHFDHVGACADFQRDGIKIYMSAKDKEVLNSSENTGMGNFDKFETVDLPERLYLEDDVLRVIETPGHTPGSVCFIFGDFLFTGDTLFKESFGRYDLYGGNFEDLKSSIFDILFNLNSRFEVLSGHGEESNLGHEKQYNFINYYRYE